MSPVCIVCAESTKGAWPRWHKGTHCRDCHKSWTSLTAAHSMCCHLTFSSNSAAEAHLVRGHCTDPSTLPAFELVTRANGHQYWTPTTGVESCDSSDEPQDWVCPAGTELSDHADWPSCPSFDGQPCESQIAAVER